LKGMRLLCVGMPQHSAVPDSTRCAGHDDKSAWVSQAKGRPMLWHALGTTTADQASTSRTLRGDHPPSPLKRVGRCKCAPRRNASGQAVSPLLLLPGTSRKHSRASGGTRLHSCRWTRSHSGGTKQYATCLLAPSAPALAAIQAGRSAWVVVTWSGRAR